MLVKKWKAIDPTVRDYLIAVPIALMLVALVILGGYHYSPDKVTRPAGEVKSLVLHDSAFSTITTLETTDGWYQLEGAVSGAKGDVVSIQAQGAYRKACIASQDRRRVTIFAEYDLNSNAQSVKSRDR